MLLQLAPRGGIDGRLPRGQAQAQAHRAFAHLQICGEKKARKAVESGKEGARRELTNNSAAGLLSSEEDKLTKQRIRERKGDCGPARLQASRLRWLEPLRLANVMGERGQPLAGVAGSNEGPQGEAKGHGDHGPEAPIQRAVEQHRLGVEKGACDARSHA